MATIEAPKRVNDNFGDGLNKFFNIVEEVRRLQPGEDIVIDMNQCVFLTPFFLLPVFLFLRKQSEQNNIIIQTHEGYHNCTAYLKNIFFTPGFDGFTPEVYPRDTYVTLLETYARKTYIPVTSFPVSRKAETTETRDHLLGCINNLLTRQLGLSGPYRTGVMYLIDEAVNNVVDHSTAERGFIFAQFFPSNGYIDICIGDSGTGILGSYQNAGIATITTDRDAIISAANGVSTKNRPEAEGRGFGISTSLDMLVNGLKGKYFLLSGAAFLLKNTQKETVTSISEELRHQGTIVALRIPYAGNATFNPASYFG